MDGLKRFLLKERQDQFVLAMTYKLCVYALGRPLRIFRSCSRRSDRLSSPSARRRAGLADQLIGTSELFYHHERLL